MDGQVSRIKETLGAVSNIYFGRSEWAQKIGNLIKVRDPHQGHVQQCCD